MTPRMSIIGSAIRKIYGSVIDVSGDIYWGNVVLASRFDITADTQWNNVALALHMDGADNGTIFTDEKGKTVTASGNVCTKTATKKFGTASAYFDGTGDYLSVASHADFGFATGEFTAELWVNTTADGTVFDFRASADQIGACAVSSGRMAWWNGVEYLTCNTPVNTGTWTHLAWVRYGGQVMMFVNGVIDGICESTTNLGTSRALRIGADYAGANGFNGYIDDVRISKVARYAGIFSTKPYPFMEPNNKPVFLEETGKTGTASGGVTTSTTAKFGSGSVYFDGVDDTLTVPSSSDFDFGTGDFTIDFWVRPDGNANGTIVARCVPSSSSMILKVARTGGALVVTLQGSSGDLSSFSGGAIPASEWSHIAVVRSVGEIRGYVNGVKWITGESAQNLTPLASADVTVGYELSQFGTVANLFKGHVDDLRITKGVARYLPNFTPPAKEIPNDVAESLDPHWDKVVLAMHMDGADNGTTFTDVKGKAITSTGAITKTDVKRFGTASAYFDGVNDRLSAASSSDFSMSSTFTVEFWINPQTISGQQRFVEFYADASNSWRVDRDGADLRWVVILSGSGYVHITANNAIKQNVWQHVAFVKSGATFQLYVNGKLVGTTNTTTYPANTSFALHVGAGISSSYYLGYMDDLRITKDVARYTTDFVPLQVQFPEKAFTPKPYIADPHWDKVVLAMHMDGADNGTTFTDAKGKTITINGNTCTKTGVKRFGSASAYFDGAGDYLSVPSSSDFDFGTGDFTIETWVYIAGDSTQSSDASKRTALIFSVDNGTPASTKLEFAIVGSSAVTGTGLSIYNGTTGLTVSGTISKLEWHHIAVSRSGSNFYFFLDGVQMGDTQVSSVSFGSNLYPGKVGGRNFSSNYYFYLNGYIDDLRITKGVGRYLSDFTPPAAFPEKKPFVSATAARYWRITNITVPGGAYLEISELQLFSDGVRVDGTSTLTASSAPTEALANLKDGNPSSRCYWTEAVAEDPAFYIQYDFGSGNAVAVNGVKQGGFDNAARYMSGFTLKYSNNGTDWTTLGSKSGLTFPGGYTLSELYSF